MSAVYTPDLDRVMRQPDNTIARDAWPALRTDDIEQGLGALGVTLRAGAALDLGHGVRDRERAPVHAILGHRVEGVAHADHARPERDALGREPLRIPGAVPALVACTYQRDELGEVGDRLQNSRADLGVLAHLGRLARRQRAGLSQDHLGDADLADVVHARRHAGDERLAQ